MEAVRYALRLGPTLAALGCSSSLSYDVPDEICTNERDDDIDGRIDCADPDCDGLCGESGGLCVDGRDNDLDGLVDSEEVACWFEPNRLETVRCTTIAGTAFDESDPAGRAWLGAVRFGEHGLVGPDNGPSFFATLQTPLTGDVSTLEVVAALTLEVPRTTTELRLEAHEDTPEGSAPTITLRFERLDASLDVELSGRETQSTSFDLHEHELARITVRWTFGADLAPCALPPCRGIRASVEVNGAVRSLDLEGEPALADRSRNDAAARRLVWSGSGPSRSVHLGRLRVSAPPFHPCDEPVPSPVLTPFFEVHSLASAGPRPGATVCLIGADAEGRLLVARGEVDFGLSGGASPPRWQATSRLDASARFGVVTWSDTLSSFLLVTQTAADQPTTLAIRRSTTCDDAWTAPTPLMIARDEAPLPATLRPVNVAERDRGRLRVWLHEESPPPAPFLPCEMRLGETLCTVVESEVLNRGSVRPTVLPATTGFTLRGQLVLVDGGGIPGALRVFDFDGFGGIVVEGATRAGSEDRFIHQGALWLEETPVLDPASTEDQTVRRGWFVYTAGQRQGGPRATSIARARILGSEP